MNDLILIVINCELIKHFQPLFIYFNDNDLERLFLISLDLRFLIELLSFKCVMWHEGQRLQYTSHCLNVSTRI